MSDREVVARYRIDPMWQEAMGGEEVVVYDDGTVEVVTFSGSYATGEQV